MLQAQNRRPLGSEGPVPSDAHSESRANLSAEQPRSLFRSGRAVQKLGVDVLVVLLNGGALMQASYRFTAYDVLLTLSEGESHWI